MSNLGHMKGRGKITICQCCHILNKKKLSLINDKSWQHEADIYFDMIKGESAGYDDLTEVYYQMIEDKLSDYDFKQIEISYMEIIGKTVVWLDGKFKGYLEEWLEQD